MADSIIELEASLRAVTERLDRVERRYRGLRSVVGAAIAAMAAVGLLAASSSQAIRARSIELVDGQGRVRVHMAAEGKSSQPYVGLLDTAGRYRASLQLADNQNPQLRLWNSRGVDSFSLEAYSDHGSTAQFYDNGASRRLVVGEYRNREYGETVYDSREHALVDLGQAGEQGLFDIFGPDGKTVLASLFGDKNGPGLQLRDTGGNARFYSGEYSDHAWGLNLKSAGGTTVWKAP
jgi:hypothetical protein